MPSGRTFGEIRNILTNQFPAFLNSVEFFRINNLIKFTIPSRKQSADILTAHQVNQTDQTVTLALMEFPFHHPMAHTRI
jgi:hypothetical protein